MQKSIHIPAPFSPLFFFVLVGWKLLFFLLFQFSIEDLWHQQTLAINFANGYGLKYIQATVTNLSDWHTSTLFKWPPLISVLLAGLMQVTGSMELATGLLIGLALLVLFTAIRSLVLHLKLPLVAQWLLWLLFLLNPTLTDLFSVTDLLSVAAWMAGFAFVVRLLVSGKKQQPYLLSVLLFLPAAFRYQYYPLVFLLPFCLWFIGFTNRNPTFKRYGLITGAGVLTLLLLQVSTLRLLGGAGAYLSDEWGGSIHNLVRMSPFFLEAVLPVYLPVNGVAHFFQIDILVLKQAVSLLSLAGFVVFVFFLLRKPTTGIHAVVRFISLVTILALLLYLSLLSLLFKEQVNGATTFTYVQESRYWGLALLLIPLLLACWLRNQSARVLISGLIVVLVLNVPPVVYRLYKPIVKKEYSSYYSTRMQFKTHTAALIEQLQRSQERPVVLACVDADFAMYNSSRPYATVAFDSLLNKGIVATTKPVWFLLITRAQLTPAEALFIQKNQLLPLLAEPGTYRLFRNR